jgi:Tfp pilus assembly protein PilF
MESALLAKEGRLEEAEYTIKQGMLLDPNNPGLWLQQARLQQTRGQRSLAAASVQYALAVWENADSEYHRVREARDMLASLSS